MIPIAFTTRRALAMLILQSAVFALLPGCDQLFGPSDRHVGRSVSRSELMGLWSATKESMGRLKELGYRDHVGVEDHRFELRDNGSCSFRSFPHYAGPQTAVEVAGQVPVPDYISVDARCGWRVVSDRIYAFGNERRVPVVEFQMSSREAPITMSARFYVAEKDGRLMLWDYVGEPEDERHIEFVRE